MSSLRSRVESRPIGQQVRCEPALSRKVHWVAPAHAELAPRIEAWLRENTARIESAQERWFGDRQHLDALGNGCDDLWASRDHQKNH